MHTRRSSAVPWARCWWTSRDPRLGRRRSRCSWVRRDRQLLTTEDGDRPFLACQRGAARPAEPHPRSSRMILLTYGDTADGAIGVKTGEGVLDLAAAALEAGWPTPPTARSVIDEGLA